MLNGISIDTRRKLMELGSGSFTKNLLINSLNRLPQSTDSNTKLSNPTNKPQICNSFCFQCPLKLDPIALTADMSITRLKLKIGTNKT